MESNIELKKEKKLSLIIVIIILIICIKSISKEDWSNILRS